MYHSCYLQLCYLQDAHLYEKSFTAVVKFNYPCLSLCTSVVHQLRGIPLPTIWFKSACVHVTEVSDPSPHEEAVVGLDTLLPQSCLLSFSPGNHYISFHVLSITAHTLMALRKFTSAYGEKRSMKHKLKHKLQCFQRNANWAKFSELQTAVCAPHAQQPRVWYVLGIRGEQIRNKREIKQC